MNEVFSDSYAQAQDAADPLRMFRDEFHIPQHDGVSQAYFCGNSLGLQPRGARAMVEEVLDKWARDAVEGHFTEPAPWMPYHELVREPLARLVGAQPSEVVAMNSLTANLHLMMVSFYQPTIERTAILIEAGAFPSDRHAVASQLGYRGLPTNLCLIEVEADAPDGTISMQAIERAIAEHGPRLALILWPGVQYRTGQAFDLKEIARLGHAAGAIVGFDLAHAVGNVRCNCMTAVPTSRCGAITNISIPVLARSRVVSCTNAMPTPIARALPAGGATNRPRASAWARNSCRRRAPMAGN